MNEEELEEGEVICNKCNGKGWIEVPDDQDLLKFCGKCQGVGRLDWIENIMGKVYEPPFWPKMDPDGPVDLYYEGNKILETTKSGIRHYIHIGTGK